MNVTGLKNLVTRNFSRRVLVAQKHSPTMLFAAGVVGVVATVVLASRATLKLEEVLDEAQQELAMAEDLHESGNEKYSERDYHQDVALVWAKAGIKVAKLYGPAFIVGTLSIGSLAGSHRILTKRNAGLMAAYAAVEKGFAEYRQRVIAEVGEDKEREFRYGKVTEEITVHTEKGLETKTVSKPDPNVRSIYARFFDEYSKNWNRIPEYNLLFLKCQQNYANDMLQARGHVFLNEVYDMLGLDRSRAGSVVGWILSKDGDNFVDFGIFDRENGRARDFVNGREPSILLDFNVNGVIYDQLR